MTQELRLDVLPAWVLVALGVAAVVQYAITIWALVDLWRTPVERVQTGKKWVWVLIILLVNLIGAIVYLAAGKKPALVADDPAREGVSHRASGAVDVLYGDLSARPEATPEALADDPEIGADGTGAGGLP